MKNLVYSILIISGLSFLGSCFHNPQPGSERLLEQAEKLVDNYPDSAMLLIDSLFYPEKSLKHESYMRYLVTQVQAKYKTFRPIDQDTLIFQARDYFSGHDKNPRMAALACFYSGCVYRERKDFDNAMQNYSTARDYAVKTDDPDLQGLVKYNMGDLFAEKGLYKEAMEYYNEAEDFYLKSPEKPYEKQARSFSAIGRMYMLLQQPDSAFLYFIKMIFKCVMYVSFVTLVSIVGFLYQKKRTCFPSRLDAITIHIPENGIINSKLKNIMYKQTFDKISTVVLFVLLIHTSTVLPQNSPLILDTTFLKCEYKTNYYTDTLAMDNGIWMNDEYILQIGTKVSKYFSKMTDKYERVQSDPKAKEVYGKELELALEKARTSGGYMAQAPLARKGTLVIYHNYPQDRRTIQDAIFFDYYIFEDDNLPQQWSIVADSMKTILGYKCRKAVCTYRGRNYEAWYALDLPINAGPWKFSGLPGLIMSVQDTKGHYTFEISGLEKAKEPIEYIEYSARKYTRTDRMTFLRTNAKASNIGWAKYLEANSPQKTGTDVKLSGGGAKYNLLERDF